ncbi:MAG: hypothetical protein R2755_02455 [Acidimicrobiales bacterium]
MDLLPPIDHRRARRAVHRGELLEVPGPHDDLVLLDTELDSLGYAVLVTRLDERLGYDLSLMEESVLPRDARGLRGGLPALRPDQPLAHDGPSAAGRVYGVLDGGRFVSYETLRSDPFRLTEGCPPGARIALRSDDAWRCWVPCSPWTAGSMRSGCCPRYPDRRRGSPG